MDDFVGDIDDFKLINSIINEENNNNNIKNISPYHDKIVLNNDGKGKILEIDSDSMDCICNYIDNLFSLDNFSLFKTERKVLEYFYQRENECLEYMDINLRDNIELHIFFRNYAVNIIKEKYENNNEISNIKTNIKKWEEKIIENYRKHNNLKIDDLDEIFFKIFKTKKIPRFIKTKVKQEIESIQLIKKLNKKNNKRTKKNEIENENENKNFNSTDKEVNLISYYNKILSGEIEPFECVDKKVIFNILLYSNLKDIYKNEKIKNIFIDNYLVISELLKYYDTQFEGLITIHKNQSYIENKLIKCFNEYEINDSHIYNLASFFYLIMNIMKDSNNKNIIYLKLNEDKYNNNQNNPLFNKLLKNILYNFFTYCPNENYSFEVYTDLIHYYNNYIITNKRGEKINKKYNLNDIAKKILMSKNKDLYTDFENYKKEIFKKEGLNKAINDLKKNIFLIKENYDSKITLIPLIENRHSNTITILISGFLSEQDDINSWENFFNYDQSNSNYYLFRWPSSHIFNLVTKLLNTINVFLKCKKIAKYAGKILALFLVCNEEFNNCQINLVGFSLGSQVIKHCIKELDKIKGHRDMINIVLFLGGATIIRDSKKFIWRNIFENNVGGRIINCYSKKDNILKYLFTQAIQKEPIGIKKIDLKDKDNEYYVIEDYDFSHLNLGHLDYRDKFYEILNEINLIN